MTAPGTQHAFGDYRIVELLGAGAHGTVYLAESPQGLRVALKSLHDERAATADLKREFRLVGDLTHPNLVLPYSLEAQGNRIFITMELVAGLPWMDWARSLDAETRDECLGNALSQLCDGLLALHRRGMIHRDVKSSNVLVEANGRVAILDFGLARLVSSRPDGFTHYVGGTPAYLAPELLAGSPPSPASDAYAVGVLLHEALTGSLPYASGVGESLHQRCTAGEAPSLPMSGTLADICVRLLEPEPAHRIALTEVIVALTGARSGSTVVPRPNFFVGREDELLLLEQVWTQSRVDGGAHVVHLQGSSGMGKSALLRSFGERVTGKSWILEARAYEQDSVPYKAIDAAIDQLTGLIEKLTLADRTALAPSDVSALGDLFPGLAAVFGVQGRSPPAVQDAQALLRRGSRALHELLREVSRKFGLVILLDDVHWGDRDSVRLLADVLSPAMFPCLLVVAYRPELANSAFLDELARLPARQSTAVTVKPLALDTALKMARGLSSSEERALAVAGEAAGCPFLIELLASAMPVAVSARTIDSLLVERILSVPVPARELLDLVCLAGRPISIDQIPVKGLAPSDALAQFRRLLGARLLRTSAATLGEANIVSGQAVEPYHDRIREAVTANLQPVARREMHRALGDSFARHNDAEGAAVHLAAANDGVRAIGFARIAADAASAALAFDRAAELLALGISCSEEPSTTHELELERARALANAGRGSEAGPLFLACAARVEGLTRIDLRRQAMEWDPLESTCRHASLSIL